MNFDVALPGTNHLPGRWKWAHELTPPELKRILEVADELGYTSVTVPEHFAMPYFEVPRLGAYWQDALSVMAFAAAATTNVRIDATVLVLPYHHPLQLAKALATIDVLSGGRLNVSVGVGHAEQEFTVLGVPFSRRGAITDEILDILDILWREEKPEYHGEHFEVSGLAFEPKPVQRPRPPIYVGGNSKPALRRAARHDGWQPNPTGFTLDEIPPLLDYLRAQPEYSGKADTFDVNWLEPPADVPIPRSFASAGAAELHAYRDRLVEAYATDYPAAGVTRTAIGLPPGIACTAEYLDYLRWFAAEVMPTVS
ncbi:TIGR03619 family F420-dependent LLM class oxidoreductase [Amycolatopsis taiwanensis]|uniref:LLM class F420-dependent oxidoreductase n=1 Tax=Amycolatopsis taiwanensis TaxID=342230 RepID=A0A9W6QYY4_9PSEU|nr:TIGR03619 family F420-dependent LLM class oxidoreductase [Amycolatopsis taiwanensis]GLY65416.1 LLM class F420-dependent oxidoreductase [Amycolatopsis taiwanensis]